MHGTPRKKEWKQASVKVCSCWRAMYRCAWLVVAVLIDVSAGQSDVVTVRACSSWRYEDAFYVTRASVAEAAVVQRVHSRSFVECCAACLSHASCSGVTFRERDCTLINATAAAPAFVVSNGSGDDVKVMVYSTAADQQVGLSNT